MDGIITELVNWPEYSKVFLAIFALVSPPFVLPTFLSVMAGRSEAEMKRAASIASIAFLTVMIAFIFFGMGLLNGIGISLYGFQIAGGLFLLRTGFEMIYNDLNMGDEGENLKGSLVGISIMPITIPVLAGPGALSAVTVFSSQYDVDPLGHKLVVLAVIVMLTVMIFFTFRFAAALERLLNPALMSLMGKIMGLLICAIAAEFILYGIAGHFPQLEVI